jgi:hypothetical protein
LIRTEPVRESSAPSVTPAEPAPENEMR